MRLEGAYQDTISEIFLVLYLSCVVQTHASVDPKEGQDFEIVHRFLSHFVSH